MTMPGDEPDLENGASGDAVTELQRQLQLLGHLQRDPDGTYDDATRDAVEQFQSSVGHATDGRVGRETWAALAEHTAHVDGSGGAPSEHSGEPSAGQASEDGQWVWDGNRWVGSTDGHPEPTATQHEDGVGQLSEDRQWRWDGVEWQPVNH